MSIITLDTTLLGSLAELTTVQVKSEKLMVAHAMAMSYILQDGPRLYAFLKHNWALIQSPALFEHSNKRFTSQIDSIKLDALGMTAHI